MKNKLFLILFVFFISCIGKETVEIPATVFSKEKMVAIMTDIHLIEATMNLNVLGPQSVNNTNNSSPVIDVFTKHHITKEQYDASFLFYTQHPEMLNDIYKEVLNELSKMQAQVANDK